MALKLRQSPLPKRIDPPQPRRHWIWTEPGPYHAVFAQTEAALLRLLHHPGQLLRFEDGGLCLIFDNPVTLDPAETSALPLRRIGPDSYTSYQPDGTPPRGLTIITQGTPKRLRLEAATPMDPIRFWDFSRMPVLTGRALPQSQTNLPKVAKPRKDSPPQVSHALRAIAGKSDSFKDVRERLADATDLQMPPLLRATGHFITRLMASVALIVLFFLIVAIAIGLGGSISPIVGGLTVALLFWFFGFFGGRTVDTEENGASGAARPKPRARPKGSGFLDRLRGLALWNTPLGNALRRDIQRHLDQVNKMIDQGDIDRALKRALSLARDEKAKEKRKSPLMTTPPKPRGKLDFDLERDSTETVAIPGDWGFKTLREKYRKLAEDLSAKGDHKRAAFVYAELLDMTTPALLELEKMKAYEDAAKLATARKEEGPKIARLWFLAGKKEIALLMARRHDCMEQLATLSEKDAEFSAFVRMHWIEDLIAEGNLPRAVQESADNPRLADTHLRVLGQALACGHVHDHPVLERAVQNLPWPIEALNGASPGDTVGAQVAQIVHKGATQAEAGEVRHALKRAAERMDESDPRKAALADALVRASLAFDADTPYALSAKDLRRFAHAQGCQALAEDLRQIHRAGPTKPQTQMDMRLPKSGHGRWTMAAALNRGAALVGSKTGDLALIDSQGVKRWTDHLPDLVGMTPIGVGRLVLLLQGRDADRRISLLDTARHTYRALGSTKLIAWDAYAGTGLWQVQTPDAIGALDLNKLLADPPCFEMLWSITQTIPVKVIAFQNNQFSVRWLTQRIESHGMGLIEQWSLYRPNLKMTVTLEDKTMGRRLADAPYIWRDGQFSRLVSDEAMNETFLFHGSPSTLEAEQKLTAEIKNDLNARKAFALVTPVPEGAAHAVQVPTPDQSTIRLTHKTKKAVAQIKGHDIAAQSASRNAEHLVILTTSGLVILCDFKSLSVLAV